MEKVNIDYSAKNIPLPSRTGYRQRLIEETEQFLRWARWKVYFFLNPEIAPSDKENYRFQSTKNPPPNEEVKDFENIMVRMIQSVMFRHVNNSFLNKLKEDTDIIRKEPELIIPADKTTKFYKLEPSTYNDLLEKNIMKSCKNTTPEITRAMHEDNKDIAGKLKIDDRVDTMAERDTFITLKDDKPNFTDRPTCRQINPMECDIGKGSKEIFDCINTITVQKCNF